jgi:tetratricopeptide (TPR) repeat protein
VTRTCLAAILGIAIAAGESGGALRLDGAGAQAHDHAAADAAKKPVFWLPGMGAYRHSIHTRSPEAQMFFNQGLILYYGFNHDEAIRSFDRSAELDPASPMPWWGKALSLGRNYNRDEEPELEKAAYQSLQKALELAGSAPENERDYVTALSARYSADPKADHKKLAVAYKNAMGDLMRRYPDDLEVATLYAEAAMNLRPWQLWNKDGTPAEGTAEIVAVLESVLARDPLHLGANHYYIHAVEASPHPERALPSAARLGSLAPGAGHLVHMPAHIYARVGDHEASAHANEMAAYADRAYIKLTGVTGMYPLMYYSHNLHFLVEADKMRGDYAGAKRAADQLIANVRPGVKEMPMAEAFLPTPLFVALRFQRWPDVLAEPAPESNLKLTTAFWRFSRGVALACSGHADDAEKERQEFTLAADAVPASTPYGINYVKKVLELAGVVLDARISAAKGDASRAIELWKRAVTAEDALNYDEPPAWYYPVRESLGGALLRASHFAEAEKVFREDLARNPRNPRSLFGLAEALAGQGKSADEAWVRAEFRTAWMHADVKLSVGDL